MCVPECPIDAIRPDTDKDLDVAFWTELNRSLASQWPRITKAHDPLPDAAEWNGRPDKLQYLERNYK